MSPQIEEATAGTNCGGLKLVAVQSYSTSCLRQHFRSRNMANSIGFPKFDVMSFGGWLDANAKSPPVHPIFGGGRGDKMRNRQLRAEAKSTKNGDQQPPALAYRGSRS
jgi:hypothetical protein